MATDEEFQEFVAKNKELIEKMMDAQREDFIPSREIRIDIAEEAKDTTIAAAKLAKNKTEEFVVKTYEMITDETVQKHFMRMGMEFVAGLSAMIEKAPIPDKIKDSVLEMEKNAKDVACEENENCIVKTRQKIDITEQE